MPTPQDLVYSAAFGQMNKAGFTLRDCETAGAQAVRYWRRNTKLSDAVDRAVKEQKKVGTKCS